MKRILDQRQPDLTVVADSVHKSHNVSAVLRTCDAAGVRTLHAVAGTGTMLRHHMVAGGSKRWVRIEVAITISDVYRKLRSDGFRILIAHGKEGAVDYRDCDYTQKTAIVLGAERAGPSDEAVRGADASIAVPMHGMVESLNVSVAAAIILYEAERQKLAAGHYEHCKIGESDYAKTLFEWAHPDIARRCREAGLAYPALTADGDLAANPFAKPRRQSRTGRSSAEDLP